jgi:hypothetical protein
VDRVFGDVGEERIPDHHRSLQVRTEAVTNGGSTDMQAKKGVLAITASFPRPCEFVR